MKKILLLISALVVIVSISILSTLKEKKVISGSEYGTFRNYMPTKTPFKPENKGWEYVKNRLFDGKTSRTPKFIGAISYLLEGATAQDSLIVDSLMRQFRVLAPNKTIEYFLNTHGSISEDGTFVTNKNNDKISLHDNKNSVVIGLSFDDKDFRSRYVYSPGFSKLDDGGIVFQDQFVHSNKNKIDYTKVYFDLKEGISFEKREQYISYFFWRSLCKIHLEPNTIGISAVSKPRMNSVFNTAELNPINYSFTKEDEFLLKKLYSDDFLSQFKDFLYSNYNLGYAFNFINYGLMRSIVISIIVLLSLFVFVLSFSLFSSKKFKYLNYLIPFLIVSIVIVNLYLFHSNMKYESDFRLDEEILAFNILGILLAVFGAFITWFLEKYLLKDKFDFSLRLLLKASFVFLAIQLPMIILNFILNKSVGFEYDYTIVTNIALLLAFGRGLLIYLNHFSDSLIKEKDVELSRLKELNAQNELKSLHSHINPHFLYNALNSIASLVYENPKKTEEMTISLSDLFKYSINRKGEKMSTIANEVEMVENYLKIEKIRFEERLNFSIDVEEGLLEEEIPMYVLQPLIENAIKHGISNIDEDGKIELVLKKEANKLLITVSDNGPDFPDGLLCGHGLQSVYDLLRLSYGELATMNWENSPKKSIVISITSNS